MAELGAVLFRYRGWVPVLPILYALAAADYHPLRMAVGLLLMALGEGLRLWGAAHLGKTARSSRPKSAKLVTRGPYAHTRHPLYVGNFALATGFALASGAGFPWFPALIAIGFVLLYRGHARREEAVLSRAFPMEYARYRDLVPGVGWKVSPARVAGAGERGRPGLARALRVEALTLNAEWWLVLGLCARFRWGGGLASLLTG